MVKGLRSLKRKLDRIPDRVKQAAQEVHANNARELVAAQVALAPIDPDGGGRLKASIRSGPIGGGKVGVDVRAGGPTTTRPVRSGAKATYDYALAQEFGTENAPAQPFFYTPYRALKRRFKGRQSRATKKALQSAGR